jgi:hypothetical protein
MYYYEGDGETDPATVTINFETIDDTEERMTIDLSTADAKLLRKFLRLCLDQAAS